MRLTTGREHIAQAEAEARELLDLCDSLLAPPTLHGPRGFVRGSFIGSTFIPAPKTSREVARERLWCIVLQDREMCPAWRWALQAYRSRTTSACGALLERMGIYPSGARHRYRWERRR